MGHHLPRLPRRFVVGPAKSAASVLEPHYGKLKVCGSLRRGAPTIGDIDIVVTNPEPGFDPVAALSTLFPTREVVDGKDGPRKCYAIRPPGPLPIHVDIWTVPEESWGAGIMYATGPGLMNVIMRRWARHNGMSLGLMGVADAEGNIVASKTERECFEKLGWQYRPPAERSDYMSFVKPYLDEMEAAGCR